MHSKLKINMDRLFKSINKEESGDVEFPVGNNICLKKT